MGHVVDEDDSYNERFWEQVDWFILMARREAVLQQREMALQKRELQCSQEERGLDQKREEAARELTCQREEVEYEMARREKEVQQRERQCSQKERTLDQKCEESEREAARRREEVEREMRALDQKREETEREMAQRGALLEQREKDVRERERRRRVLDTCAAQTLGGEILEEPHTDSDGKEDDHLAGTLSSPLEEGEVPPSPLEEGEVPPPPRHPLGVADQPGVGGGSHAAAAAAGASRFRKPPPAPLELSRHTQTGVKAVRAPPLTAHVVTRVYRAPEVILCRGRYAQSIDNWSLGCIIAEILQFLQPPAVPRCPLFRSKTWHGPSPRQDAHAREQLAAIFRVCGTPSIQEVKGLASVTDAEALLLPPGWLIKLAHGPPLPPAWPAYGEGVPAEATRLLRGLLRFLARDRLTARQALEHPFLRPASHASHGAGACPSGGAVAQRELAEAATLHKAWGDRGGGGQSPLPLSAGPQVRKEMSGMGLERLGEQELYEIFRREIGACFLASPRARRVSGGYGA